MSCRQESRQCSVACKARVARRWEKNRARPLVYVMKQMRSKRSRRRAHEHDRADARCRLSRPRLQVSAGAVQRVLDIDAHSAVRALDQRRASESQCFVDAQPRVRQQDDQRAIGRRHRGRERGDLTGGV